jgi:transcriptional regulator with XRE-family HTH domain
MTPMRVHKPKHPGDDEIHQGRNIKNVREMLGWKQESLAEALGAGWSQKKISLLESKDIVHPREIREISIILEVPEDLFITATRAKLWRLLQNTLNDDSDFDRKEAVSNPRDHAVWRLNHIANALIECQRQLLTLYDKAHDGVRSAEDVLIKIKDTSHFIGPPSRDTGSQ